AGLAAILLVIAIAFLLQSLGGEQSADVAGAAVRGPHLIASSAALPLLICTALTAFAWATIGRMFTRFRTPILAAAAIAGVIAIPAQAIDVTPSATSAMRALTAISFLTSSFLLGGACTAMILGHWYLVIPSMEVSHLQSIVGVHIASMAARVIVVAAAVWMAIATFRPDLDPGPSFRPHIRSA